jgi:hypothetical protein
VPFGCWHFFAEWVVQRYIQECAKEEGNKIAKTNITGATNSITHRLKRLDVQVFRDYTTDI